jgi:hypothetical protein
MPPIETTTATTTVRASVVVVAVVMAAVAVVVVAVVSEAVALMVLPLLVPLQQKGSLKTPPKNLIARPVSAAKKIWTLKRPRSQKMSLIPVSTMKKIRTLKHSRSCQRRSHSFKVVLII